MSLDLTPYEATSNTVAQSAALNGALAAIQAFVNSLPLANLAGYPADATKFLRGDGSWAAPSSVPSGAIIDYGAATAPAGWLLCDGAAVSRATYSVLFGVISTTFGVGDGSTTFNVPDFRGRVPVGYAVSGGHTDVSTLALNDGVAVANRRPKHNTTISTTGFNDNNPGDVGATGNHTTGPGSTTGIATGVSQHTHVGGPGGTAAVDAPAYLVVNKIIKI